MKSILFRDVKFSIHIRRIGSIVCDGFRCGSGVPGRSVSCTGDSSAVLFVVKVPVRVVSPGGQDGIFDPSGSVLEEV